MFSLLIAAVALAALGALFGLLAFLRSGGTQRVEGAVREEARAARIEAGQRDVDLRKDLRDQIATVGSGLTGGLETTRGAVESRMDMFAARQSESADHLRFEVARAVGSFAEALKADMTAFQASTGDALKAAEGRIAALTEANEIRQNALRESIEQRLEVLRSANDAKLEQMRATVDEKLQGTLEKRLGESFALVSERLENVQRGLGEMQTLALGVGDLKKVLANVKDRGGWAEVQLGMMLENVLTRDQFDTNVSIDGSAERVEFVVRLPGQEQGGEVWLPIDAKFPKEDYERLVDAMQSGESGAIRTAQEALVRVIENEAKKISSKYVKPPRTTDFAVMYLPTEGLFAEAMRHPALVQKCQSQHRVTIAGPTTLTALLNALQMGFRTLAIQKRSGEVWRVLGEAKTEFEKYGQVWDRLKKQLETAQNTVDEAGKRTRAVARKLRAVEAIESLTPSLELTGDDEDESV